MDEQVEIVKTTITTVTTVTIVMSVRTVTIVQTSYAVIIASTKNNNFTNKHPDF